MFRPGWWSEQPLQIIAEVQICVSSIHLLGKNLHNMDEILRCTSFNEYTTLLKADPSTLESEENAYPLGLLYGIKNFAF